MRTAERSAMDASAVRSAWLSPSCMVPTATAHARPLDATPSDCGPASPSFPILASALGSGAGSASISASNAPSPRAALVAASSAYERRDTVHQSPASPI